MLLINTPDLEELPADVRVPETDEWMAFTQTLREEGILVHGAGLQDADTATSVRVRAGETEITDGPFAETKETVAGYYLVRCDDLDTALRAAARVPNAHYSTIEVRPVMHRTPEVATAAQSAA
jgi:hypothetical protein